MKKSAKSTKTKAAQPLQGLEGVLTGLRTWATEWPTWWHQQSLVQKVLPISIIATYWLGLIALHGLRSDHLNLGMIILVFSYAGPAVRPLYRFILPVLLTGIIYDSQRFYADYIRGPIHVTEPYDFDKRFFGISTPQGILTPNEWWQLHTVPALDLITGFAYLVFIAGFVLFAAYITFHLSKAGTAKVSAKEIKLKSPRIMWAFLWLNLVGYSTYYWYAAAPPWYVSMYGLGPARMDVQANAAGCLRFDQLLGTHFFTEMYGRAADIFGAIPSLHVAYPLLAIYFAFQFGGGQAFAILFYALMCFSAVYLNHHYILDIIWGSSYALLVAWLTNWICDRNQKVRPQ